MRICILIRASATVAAKPSKLQKMALSNNLIHIVYMILKILKPSFHYTRPTSQHVGLFALLNLPILAVTWKNANLWAVHGQSDDINEYALEFWLISSLAVRVRVGSVP